MEEINAYMDSTGQIHNRTVEEYGVSENGPLFTATYVLFKMLENNAYNPLRLFNPGAVFHPTKKEFHADPETEGSHFSHDNMTGVYIHTYCSFFQVNKLPVLRWNGRFWLHPRDVIFYLMMKGSIVASLLGFFIFPFMIIFSLRKPNEDTSGKCLWFLRLITLMIHRNTVVSLVGRGLFKLTSFVKRESVYKIFERYYTCNYQWANVSHPTLQVLSQITMLEEDV